MSPFELVFGKPSSVEAVDQRLQDLDEVLRSLKLNLEQARMKMKTQTNKHRKEVHFQSSNCPNPEGNGWSTQVLVQWEGLPMEGTSGMDLPVFCVVYPELIFGEDGNDTEVIEKEDDGKNFNDEIRRPIKKMSSKFIDYATNFT